MNVLMQGDSLVCFLKKHARVAWWWVNGHLHTGRPSQRTAHLLPHDAQQLPRPPVVRNRLGHLGARRADLAVVAQQVLDEERAAVEDGPVRRELEELVPELVGVGVALAQAVKAEVDAAEAEARVFVRRLALGARGHRVGLERALLGEEGLVVPQHLLDGVARLPSARADRPDGARGGERDDEAGADGGDVGSVLEADGGDEALVQVLGLGGGAALLGGGGFGCGCGFGCRFGGGYGLDAGEAGGLVGGGGGFLVERFAGHHRNYHKQES